MKNTLRKWSILALSGVLLAGCTGGGSGQNSNTDTDNSSEVAAGLPEPGDFDEKIDLWLSGSLTKGLIEDDNWVQQRLEEEFNVSIENLKIDTWNENEAAIMLASGEIPNAISITPRPMEPLELYENGLTRTIPRDMIEKYAPMYAATLDEIDNGLGWEMYRSPDNEDEYLALVGVQSHADGILWAPVLRLDWMENLGLDIPDDIKQLGDSSNNADRIYTTRTSLTIDELTDILYAFTHDDPDGNGQDDTYGLLPSNSDLNWAHTIFGAFGIAPQYNLLENDELVMGTISEGYRDALVTFSDWYADGLIDPEWTTLDLQATWEKYKQGKIGYSVAQKTYIAQEDWTKGRAPFNLLESDPDAKLLVFEPETGPEGHQGEGTFMPVTILGDSLEISKDTTDEQLARYLQIFDYINHNPEGLWSRYGIPGEHSDWQGEEGHSTLITRPEFPREEGDMGFWGYSFRTYPGDYYYYLTSEKTVELDEEFFSDPDVLEKMAIRPYRYDLFNETDLASMEQRYQAQLDTVEDEFRMRGIVGEIDIMAEWEAYVEDWMNNGGREILSEYEKAPLVSELLGN